MLFFEDLQVGSTHSSTATYRLSKDDIIGFAREWDPVPFHLDEDTARASPLGKLFASGIHSIAIAIRLAHSMKGEEFATVAGLGWDEVRFLQPACVGDELSLRSEVLSKRVSRSNPGRGIATMLLQLFNQHQQLVVSFKLNSMVLCREQPEI